MISLAQWLKNLNLPAQVGGRLHYHSRAEFESGQFELHGQGCLIKIISQKISSQAVDGDLILIKIDKPLLAGTVNLSARAEIELIQKTKQAPNIYSTAETQLKWFQFLRDIEEIFTNLGLLRVGTPTLVKSNGLEPSIEPICSEKLFLPTSPELSLKKILSHNFTDIYEMRPCFRRELSTPHHLTEFTMIEWYRGFADLKRIEADLKFIFTELYNKNWHADQRSIEVKTMEALFLEVLDLPLKPSTTLNDLQNYMTDRSQHFGSDWTFDDCFNSLFITFVEPFLANKGPVIVKNFPPSQAALARINSKGWAERIELYWNGLELANGYDELTDPLEQLRRFNFDLQRRKESYKINLPIDEEFLAALSAGLPPTAGIALGLERLFMSCLKISDIQKLKFFVAETH